MLTKCSFINRRDGIVFERFVRHHVAPVAGSCSRSDSRMGLPVERGHAPAPHHPRGYQWTGLSACCLQVGARFARASLIGGSAVFMGSQGCLRAEHYNAIRRTRIRGGGLRALDLCKLAQNVRPTRKSSPIIFSIGFLKIRWYGLMYVHRLHRRLVPGASPLAAVLVSHQGRTGRRPDLLLHAGRHPGRAAWLRVFLRL